MHRHDIDGCELYAVRSPGATGLHPRGRAGRMPPAHRIGCRAIGICRAWRHRRGRTRAGATMVCGGRDRVRSRIVAGVGLGAALAAGMTAGAAHWPVGGIVSTGHGGLGGIVGIFRPTRRRRRISRWTAAAPPTTPTTSTPAAMATPAPAATSVPDTDIGPVTAIGSQGTALCPPSSIGDFGQGGHRSLPCDRLTELRITDRIPCDRTPVGAATARGERRGRAYRRRGSGSASSPSSAGRPCSVTKASTISVNCSICSGSRPRPMSSRASAVAPTCQEAATA